MALIHVNIPQVAAFLVLDVGSIDLCWTRSTSSSPKPATASGVALSCTDSYAGGAVVLRSIPCSTTGMLQVSSSTSQVLRDSTSSLSPYYTLGATTMCQEGGQRTGMVEWKPSSKQDATERVAVMETCESCYGAEDAEDAEGDLEGKVRASGYGH